MYLDRKALRIMKSGYEYQCSFSDSYKHTAYNAAGREWKAAKAVAVIVDYLQEFEKSPEELLVLDIGCSTGYQSRYYGQFFRCVHGVDIDEKAVRHAANVNSSQNVVFQVQDCMNLSFAEATFDVVMCTHVYEHVPDAGKLISEIYRVLKPEGICYFAAGNRLMYLEPHYKLPFLSILPKPLANFYCKLSGKSNRYHETHLSFWSLKRLVKKFQIVDYVCAILQDPVKFSATEIVQPNSIKQKISLQVSKHAYWLCPTYIWILRKYCIC
jgi:SAM-dependent methyltransferase